MSITATPAHYSTADQARDAGVCGWNLRCNLCGTYGATWIPNQRPGWGDLALCPTHENDLTAELRRHKDAMTELRHINYEQDLATRPGPEEGW